MPGENNSGGEASGGDGSSLVNLRAPLVPGDAGYLASVGRAPVSAVPAPAATSAPDPMAAFAAMMSSFSAPSYDYEQAQRDADAKAEEARMTQGVNDRNKAYGDYLSLAGTATSFINSQIEDERSNAALRGVNYSIDDAQKSTRINDYFATIWGEGDQIALDNLFTEFGKPTGFEDFIVTRGEGEAPVAETATADGPSATTINGPRGGTLLSSLLQQEDTTSILGGS